MTTTMTDQEFVDGIMDWVDENYRQAVIGWTKHYTDNIRRESREKAIEDVMALDHIPVVTYSEIGSIWGRQIDNSDILKLKETDHDQ